MKNLLIILLFLPLICNARMLKISYDNPNTHPPGSYFYGVLIQYRPVGATSWSALTSQLPEDLAAEYYEFETWNWVDDFEVRASVHHGPLGGSEFETQTIWTHTFIAEQPHLSVNLGLLPEFPPDPVTPTWTTCNGDCDFFGLRQVRLCDNHGTCSYKEHFNTLKDYHCRTYKFPPANFNGSTFCQYSSEYATVSIPPAIDCLSRHDCQSMRLNEIPKGKPPHSTARVKNSNQTANSQGIGAFRTECELSHFAYDDPLVYPGQPGQSHLHTFFGNVLVNASSTAVDIRNTGDSTCDGGILNRSGYWVPSLIDSSLNLPVVPEQSIWYYKEGYNGLQGQQAMQSLPVGLRMISHDYLWKCSDSNTATYTTVPDNCPVGRYVQMEVFFPQCWDGVNLWKDDQSHMAFASSSIPGCPSSHPYVIPEISLNVRYTIREAGQAANWRLSSDHGMAADGSTAHADWVNGWDVNTSDLFIENCLNDSFDCHANMLNDGTELY